jgi:2-keto-4-pentenoate hydratase/2-oxohepta-3-ene-1,7-dioic acid hydratase in catechol pathway
MKFARHRNGGGEQPIVEGSDGRWRDLTSLTSDLTAEFVAGSGALDFAALPEVDEPTNFAPPLASVGKIVCVGLNYRDHAKETGAEPPREPILFLKAGDTVVGPYDDVLIPRRSVKTDWEVELAIVIGTTARYLESVDDAAACVAGYAVSHDVSERAFQLERGGQWDKGKNCETFNPLGPWLVTPDEVPDPQNLGLRLWVNGVQRQDGHTSNMIFGVDYLIWYISQFMVLRPGDVINSGTPAGVAMGMADTPYLRDGDVVELEIDGLGRQRQSFKPA